MHAVSRNTESARTSDSQTGSAQARMAADHSRKATPCGRVYYQPGLTDRQGKVMNEHRTREGLDPSRKGGAAHYHRPPPVKRFPKSASVRATRVTDGRSTGQLGTPPDLVTPACV